MSQASVCLGHAFAFSGVLAALNCYAGDRAQPSLISGAYHFNSATNLYTYSYKLTNPVGSVAPVDTLVIKLRHGVDVTNLRAPRGWRIFHTPEKGTVMWAATGFINPDAKDLTGNVPPSDYAIAPGATLTGFSFESFSAPGPGTAISQSYAPLYRPKNDAEYETLDTDRSLSTLPDDNGCQLATIVPMPDAE